MKLFIRSQRKDCLREVHSIECNVDREGCCVLDGCYILGEYKTEERCLEIIDEIQKLLLSANPKEAFMLLKNIESDDYNELNKKMQRARTNNFLPYCSWGDENASIEVIQPSVLVYEMPKE